MSSRKRLQEFTTTISKRPRSVLMVKRNATWGRVASRTLLQTLQEDTPGRGEANTDPVLEEAVAALLEIGGRGQLAKAYFDLRELKRDASRQLRAPERPALFKGSPPELNEEDQPCTVREDLPAQQLPSLSERLPASSSISDGSTTAEASGSPELPSARTSLDSESLAPGLEPQRGVRQHSVQLVTKIRHESNVGSLSEEQSPTNKAALSPWSANSAASVVVFPPDGRNVVSTGMPPLLLKTDEDGAGVPNVDAGPRHEQEMQPVASFSGGKLIVIAAAPARKLAEAELQRAATAPVPGKVVVHRLQAAGVPGALLGTTPSLGRTVSAAVGTDKPLWHFSATSKAAPGGGSSSGDESCDELYKPTWGLDLFSALNPSVITTGHCSFRESP